mgnify:CR=1 FL=1
MNPNYISLKKLRIPELKLLCKENKIKGISKLRKLGLVDLLFKNLYPDETKIEKTELKEPSPEPIVLKQEPLPEVEPLESLEIKVLFEPEEKVEEPTEEPIEKPTATTTPMKPPQKTKEQFDLEYLKLLKEKMEKINLKNEKKKLKKEKLKKENYLDLNDPDVINTINNLIKKIYK